MNTVRLIDIRDTALSLDELYAAVRDDQAGGITLFIGTVRNHADGHSVEALGYSSHPTARAELTKVAERIAAESDVIALAAVHRVGDLEIGDIAVIVAASAAHREQAFEAGRRLIDELKTTVPVWKYETYSSGAGEWVANHVDTTA